MCKHIADMPYMQNKAKTTLFYDFLYLQSLYILFIYRYICIIILYITDVVKKSTDVPFEVQGNLSYTENVFNTDILFSFRKQTAETTVP